MTRRLLSLLTAVSLLLCMAVAVLWVRRQDSFILAVGGRFWCVTGVSGGAYVETVSGWPVPERPRWLPGRRRDEVPYIDYQRRVRSWRCLTLRGQRAVAAVVLDEGGRPIPLARATTLPFVKKPLTWLGPMRLDAVFVPYWMLAAGASAIPLARGVLLGRRQWARRGKVLVGCCRRCGYDLTGNVSGVCPECGSAK